VIPLFIAITWYDNYLQRRISEHEAKSVNQDRYSKK